MEYFSTIGQRQKPETFEYKDLTIDDFLEIEKKAIRENKVFLIGVRGKKCVVSFYKIRSN